MLAGRYGQFNQAGDMAPHTGPYSQGLIARERVTAVDQRPVVVPFYKRAFHNFIGGVQYTNLHAGSIVGARGYNGAAPAALQPTVVRPLPWQR